MHLHPETLFLFQAFVLVGLPYLLWKLRFVSSVMPLVVVQILLGITFGPSVLGKMYPEIFNTFFSAESLNMIRGLPIVGLTFFGFLTGMHFDLRDIRGKGVAFTVTSLSSILVPASICGIAGFWLLRLFPQLTGANATTTTFVLAMAIAGGVTALPVLGAILMEMGVIDRKIGKTALGYATVNDGLLWILVAVLLALAAGGENGTVSVVSTILATLLFIIVVAFVIAPLLRKLVKRNFLTTTAHTSELVFIVCLLFIAAFCTDLIGVHYLLGSFIFGTVIPKEIAHPLQHKLEPFVLVVLLPFFFMMTGLKTEFDVGSLDVWMVFGIFTVLSSIGKFVGTAVPAALTGEPRKRALVLGCFMQCKGLMEVVVLNMMLQAGIISAVCFSGMILMAVATTAATKPFVLLAGRKIIEQERGAPATVNMGQELIHELA